MLKDTDSGLPLRPRWDDLAPIPREWELPKVTVKALGRLGPWIPQTATFGSASRFSDHDRMPVPEVDDLPDLAADAKVEVPSPVKAWRLQHANAKIREDAKKYTFKSSKGQSGSIHTARLACNDPVEDDWTVGMAKGVGGGKTMFAGIFDGHGGWATSTVLRKSLVPRVSRSLRCLGRDAEPEAVDKAISDSFTDLDRNMMQTAKDALEGAEPADPSAIAAIAPAVAGSCALLSMYNVEESLLRVACVGDSRAVLGQHVGADPGKYETKPLSVDQAGHANKDEVARVEAGHPGESDIFSEDGRLLGIMVTRAFGDHRWKWDEELVKKVHYELQGTPPKPNMTSPPYLTAEPVITTTSVTTEDFVILASDGLWDHMSSEHAVQCVVEWLEVKKGARAPTPAGEDMRHEPEFLDDYPVWYSRPEHFVIEDLDSAAVHLMKNALGGKRRKLFTSAVSAYAPVARSVRDDITVQVIFFADIEGSK